MRGGALTLTKELMFHSVSLLEGRPKLSDCGNNWWCLGQGETSMVAAPTMGERDNSMYTIRGWVTGRGRWPEYWLLEGK